MSMSTLVEARKGDWIQTYCGNRFWPLDPRPEEVHIMDIAHALSMKCRYNGHAKRFYSVAEHSVLVSQHVPPEHALWGLLHDAEEAYLPDIPRPVKKHLPFWKDISDPVQRAVCEAYNLPPNEPPVVKEIDYAICADEKLVLMADGPAWEGLGAPIGADIQCLSPSEAKADFLYRFLELTARRITYA